MSLLFKTDGEIRVVTDYAVVTRPDLEVSVAEAEADFNEAQVMLTQARNALAEYDTLLNNPVANADPIQSSVEAPVQQQPVEATQVTDPSAQDLTSVPVDAPVEPTLDPAQIPVIQ